METRVLYFALFGSKVVLVVVVVVAVLCCVVVLVLLLDVALLPVDKEKNNDDTKRERKKKVCHLFVIELATSNSIRKPSLLFGHTKLISPFLVKLSSCLFPFFL